MTEHPKADQHAEPSQEELNWPATDDSEASLNQDGTEGSTAPGARRRRHLQDDADGSSADDGTAPDQRTPDDTERGGENRGARR